MDLEKVLICFNLLKLLSVSASDFGHASKTRKAIHKFGYTSNKLVVFDMYCVYQSKAHWLF